MSKEYSKHSCKDHLSSILANMTHQTDRQFIRPHEVIIDPYNKIHNLIGEPLLKSLLV